MLEAPNAESRHSAGSSSWRASHSARRRVTRSQTIWESVWAAWSAAGEPDDSDHWCDRSTARQGRLRPDAPGASSTKPYLASWRRWNEQLAGESPSTAPASVAV